MRLLTDCAVGRRGDRQAELERMSRQVSHDVLRRMVSPPPPAPEDVPITSSRAMRLAITRAADKTHDLAIGVLGLREELVSLDDLLGMLAPDLMLIAMTQDGPMVGVAALDLQLRSALIEAQTVGKIIAADPDDRPPTRTDATMAVPLLASIIAKLQETTPRTPLDGWGQGIVPGALVANARTAGLILAERPYRVIRVTLDLQTAERQGDLLLAMPDHLVAAPTQEIPQEDGDWTARFQATVNASPVRLDAELHRFKLPLFAAESLQVGQVLPLTGCMVTSIKMRAKDGRKVATARLGQSGGMRAIRIEQAAAPDMSDLDQLGDAANREGLPVPDHDLGFVADNADTGFGDDDGGMMDMAGLAMDAEAAPMDTFGTDDATEALDDIEAALDLEGAIADAGPDAAAWGLEDEGAELPAMGQATALDWSEEDLDATSG